MFERPTFDTDLLIGDQSLIHFFPFCHQIITKIAIWMLGGRITKTRKTDIVSKLRRESSSDTLDIIFTSPCRVKF